VTSVVSRGVIFNAYSDTSYFKKPTDSYLGFYQDLYNNATHDAAVLTLATSQILKISLAKENFR
jgi:hypothetical protein